MTRGGGYLAGTTTALIYPLFRACRRVWGYLGGISGNIENEKIQLNQ
jgi:hypothetical protein